MDVAGLAAAPQAPAAALPVCMLHVGAATRLLCVIERHGAPTARCCCLLPAAAAEREPVLAILHT